MAGMDSVDAGGSAGWVEVGEGSARERAPADGSGSGSGAAAGTRVSRDGLAAAAAVGPRAARKANANVPAMSKERRAPAI